MSAAIKGGAPTRVGRSQGGARLIWANRRLGGALGPVRDLQPRALVSVLSSHLPGSDRS